MRVVVPYAESAWEGRPGVYPETRAALAADGQEPEYVDVGGSRTAYHDLLALLWADGRAFVVVEQDIVVRPGVVAELAACPRDWCGFAYSLSTGYYVGGLGCTRFAERLLRERPSVPAALDALPPDGLPRRWWQRLDTRLKSYLEGEGLSIHGHWPAVGHLNVGQQFRGAANCSRCGAPVPRERLVAGPPPYDCERCA